MKLLFLNYQDNYGAGSYRAAYRLYRGLQDSGLSCNYLVRNKLSSDSSVITVPIRGIRNKIFYKLSQQIFGKIFKKQLSSIETAWSPNFISESKRNTFFRLNPDIVHLHWICGDFVSIGNLKEIQKPVIWTMHDMWGLTGGCHYSADCDRFQQKCGSCPQLKSNNMHDLSRILYNKKRESYRQIKNMTIVSPSRWLAEKARKSKLIAGRNVHVIPNGIDHRIFKNPGKLLARDILNIPKDKLIILFGAMRGTSNPRKGFRYLVPAMHQISARIKHVEAMVIGSDGSDQRPDFGCKTTYLGVLHDELSLSLAYSAADITVVPSKEENLCTVIMESLSCGTPVVAFDIGGNADLVEHQQNGYLAKRFEVEDLARGIEWVLSDQERLAALCMRARKKIEEEFILDIIAKKHLDLYGSILHS